MNLVHKNGARIFFQCQAYFQNELDTIYTIFCSNFSQPVKRQNPAMCFSYFNTEERLHLWNLLGLVSNPAMCFGYFKTEGQLHLWNLLGLESNPAMCFGYFSTEGQLHLWNLLGLESNPAICYFNSEGRLHLWNLLDLFLEPASKKIITQNLSQICILRLLQENTFRYYLHTILQQSSLIVAPIVPVQSSLTRIVQ